MKIYGDYHTHTVYSDGRSSIMDVVLAAKERGLSEIAITDHSVGKIAKSLRKRDFKKYLAEIKSARSELPVLIGVEANIINTNGLIDIDEKMRKKLDIVLCGVHILVFYSLRALFTFCLPNLFFSAIRFTPKFQIKYNTRVVQKAIQENDIDIWTHPSLYFKIDVVEVAKTCAERGTLVELNSSRISFRPIDFERMAKVGAKFIIGSDAHKIGRVGDIARVEEFLKNCDFEPKAIINLNKTFTEFKNGTKNNDDIVGGDEAGTPRVKKRGFFRRWL